MASSWRCEVMVRNAGSSMCSCCAAATSAGVTCGCSEASAVSTVVFSLIGLLLASLSTNTTRCRRKLVYTGGVVKNMFYIRLCRPKPRTERGTMLKRQKRQIVWSASINIRQLTISYLLTIQKGYFAIVEWEFLSFIPTLNLCQTPLIFGTGARSRSIKKTPFQLSSLPPLRSIYIKRGLRKIERSTPILRVFTIIVSSFCDLATHGVSPDNMQKPAGNRQAYA
nr:MAG TPA: hypothetical protein [Caudoviricetes sp.]